MIVRLPNEPPAGAITDERIFLSRRRFLGVAAGALATASVPGLAGWAAADDVTPAPHASAFTRFLEFGPSPGDAARLAPSLLRADRWAVVVDGACRRPARMAVDDLAPASHRVDRVYRFRAGEGWSMVVPWRGVLLRDVLLRAGPDPSARYVELTSLYDPRRMPGQRGGALTWPYVEALRLDEAMHPLTLLATGAYGRALPAESGAPLRLVVPWKFGYKSIKSIVRIRLTVQRPDTSWTRAAPGRRGFYANVDPSLAGQLHERRLGEARTRPTLPFNGYAAEVAHLYAGMDARRNA